MHGQDCLYRTEKRSRKRGLRVPALKMALMTKAHIPECEAIVAGSEPWKRLNEGIDFRGIIAANRTHTSAYVCLADGKPAGFILFIPEPVFARGGYLRAIAVSPSFRVTGIGTMMLSFAEKKTARKASHLFLCVSSFNRRAHLFYEKRGYTRVGRLPGIIMPGASEFIYWKRLAGC